LRCERPCSQFICGLKDLRSDCFEKECLIRSLAERQLKIARTYAEYSQNFVEIKEKGDLRRTGSK